MLIVEEGAEGLRDYGSIPIAFEVRSRLDVKSLREGRWLEIPETPWIKDYDRIEGEGPTTWPNRFDLTAWTILSAWESQERVGGAVLVRDSSPIEMLEGRSDRALLWDIRVSPSWRGRGVGTSIFLVACALAKVRGSVGIRVETQDINVAACRFYFSRGCRLTDVNPEAYALPEIQLIWSRDL